MIAGDAVLVEEAQLDQPAGALLDRVTLGPLLDHFAGHVVRRVVLGVAVHPHGHRLDQRWALTRPGPGDRPGGGLVHREHVDAVHPLTGHAVRDCLGRDVADALVKASGVE